MKFCNSHLTRNIFNLHMLRFFFGLVYMRLLHRITFDLAEKKGNSVISYSIVFFLYGFFRGHISRNLRKELRIKSVFCAAIDGFLFLDSHKNISFLR